MREKERNREKSGNDRKKEKKISYIVLIIFAILFVLPLCWVILASLDSNANIAAKIPELTLNNYKEILTSGTTWYSLKNGLKSVIKVMLLLKLWLNMFVKVMLL